MFTYPITLPDVKGALYNNAGKPIVHRIPNTPNEPLTNNRPAWRYTYCHVR